MKNCFLAAITLITVVFATAAFSDWTYGGQWGSLGSGNGQFNAPHGAACAPDGNIFVADGSNHRVQYFTATGSYLGQWGTYGTGNGQFNNPYGVTSR